MNKWDVMRDVVNLTVIDAIKQANQVITSVDGSTSYCITITNNIFMDVTVNENDVGTISIGNEGIHLNCTFVHNIRMDLKTEEEFFQNSLIENYGDLDYSDYVKMVLFQKKMVTALPLYRRKKNEKVPSGRLCS